jgi:hypothetical protein
MNWSYLKKKPISQQQQKKIQNLPGFLQQPQNTKDILLCRGMTLNTIQWVQLLADNTYNGGNLTTIVFPFLVSSLPIQNCFILKQVRWLEDTALQSQK